MSTTKNATVVSAKTLGNAKLAQMGGTKMQPATPLPLGLGAQCDDEKAQIINADGEHIAYVESYPHGEIAAYIAHAANAYPKLVETLKSSERRFQSFARNFSGDAALIALHDAEFCRALLRELGEE